MAGVRTLLDEHFAPITSSIGFLRVPLSRAAAGLTMWRRDQRPGLQVVSRAEPLDGALRRLLPLQAGVPRALLIEVRDGWCAYFDCSPEGTDTTATIAHLTRTLRCDGLEIVTVPQTAGRPGVRRGRTGRLRWRLSYRTEWTHRVREVGLVYRDARWDFAAAGPVQPYEDTVAYRAPRVRDRFTSARLESYCQALGLDVFDPASYGPAATLLEYRVPRYRRYHHQTLAEVQRRLEISPGQATALPG